MNPTKKMTRKAFDESRQSYWPKAKMELETGELSTLVGLALLSDIHTMLEHIIIEPKEEEE